MEASVFALVVLLVLGVGVAAVVFWVIYLVEVVKTPEAQWRAAGQNQLLHLLLMLLLGIIGTIIYLASARPALQRVGPPPVGYGPPPGYYPPPGYQPPSYPRPPDHPPTQTPPPAG